MVVVVIQEIILTLSWLSDKLNLSFNWNDNIMKQREKQTEWFRFN